MGKKVTMNKEEIAEDYCFVCKDGGSLRVCDFGDCLKAYHPECVEKDRSFMESNEHWTCGWHSCFICHKSSTLKCYCCPQSVCLCCLKKAEFAIVYERTKGFCNNCLYLACLIEENIDVNSDGEKVDFRDTETCEFLFKEYWEIVRNQEGLTLADLQAAKDFLEKGKTLRGRSGPNRLLEEDKRYEVSDLEDNSDNEMSFLEQLKRKHHRKKPMKRSRSMKRTFIGWGSTELINFLTSIGKDTKEPLTQFDACEILKDYIQENNLHHQDNKKKKYVICDDKLYALFRKRKVRFYRLYNLLESHFVVNDESDDPFGSSSEEDDYTIGTRKKHTISADVKNDKCNLKIYEENISEPPESCYAAIVWKNINSVYLKKSLIIKLLKNPDAFEGKVCGCFVRVKIDPKEFCFVPGKLYKLGQVTGIKKAIQTYKIGEISTDMVLCVSDIHKDVLITMLSDDDFEEEECEDLCQLAKKGIFRRPTIAELEEKTRSVHADIINHWIDTESVKLQRLIDRANEKGWRRELFEYIDKREKLQSFEERQRLLQEIPPLIADPEIETASTFLSCRKGRNVNNSKLQTFSTQDDK